MKQVCYRGSDGDDAPVICHYETEFGFPHFCINEHGQREQMFRNTHFLTEKMAWRSIMASAKAGLSLSGREVEHIRSLLAKAEKQAADAVVRYQSITSNPKNPFRYDP